MNRHLTADERAAWAYGDRNGAAQAHVAICADCRRNVEAFDDALLGFRSAVSNWGAQPRPPVRQPIGDWNRFTLAAAALTFGGLISLGFLPGSARPALPEDAQLFRQIGAEISRQVPGPMEPLLNLIDETAQTGETR